MQTAMRENKGDSMKNIKVSYQKLPVFDHFRDIPDISYESDIDVDCGLSDVSLDEDVKCSSK